MNDAINLIDDILKNMEYIRLLLSAGHKYVTPLHTFNMVIEKLNKLKNMLDINYLTPEQIREAVIRLENSEDSNFSYNLSSKKFLPHTASSKYSGL